MLEAPKYGYLFSDLEVLFWFQVGSCLGLPPTTSPEQPIHQLFQVFLSFSYLWAFFFQVLIQRRWPDNKVDEFCKTYFSIWFKAFFSPVQWNYLVLAISLQQSVNWSPPLFPQESILQVFYHLDESLLPQDETVIRQSMQTIEDLSCVRYFHPFTMESLFCGESQTNSNSIINSNNKIGITWN